MCIVLLIHISHLSIKWGIIGHNSERNAVYKLNMQAERQLRVLHVLVITQHLVYFCFNVCAKHDVQS